MRCETCHLSYSESDPLERRRHRVFHDQFLRGIPWKPWKNERVLATGGGFRVVGVDRSSPKFLRVRTRKLGDLGNVETGFDCEIFSEYSVMQSALVSVADDRGVALLVMEPVQFVWTGRWEDIPRNRIPARPVPRKPRRIGCSFLWVHPRWRGRRIAAILCDTACRLQHVVREDMPWMPPFTEEGRRFLQVYCPKRVTFGWQEELRQFFASPLHLAGETDPEFIRE
ncbi:MAG: hypothetical protein GWO19_09090 [Nitrospinaceae bacterium]|nr:hypothetical protein [Nitrospinaceae bacterium]NIU96363.1 hypothetical protein [Nitrospinaceae bacterium]